MFGIREAAFQFFKSLDRQRNIFQLVFINHRFIVKRIFDNQVRSVDIFRCQWQLLDIKLACFRIVGRHFRQSSFCRCGIDGSSCFCTCYFCRVCSGIVACLVECGHLLVVTTPVIFQGSTSPFALKLRFSLSYGLRIVKIETTCTSCCYRAGTYLSSRSVNARTLRFLLRQIGFFSSFFFG